MYIMQIAKNHMRGGNRHLMAKKSYKMTPEKRAYHREYARRWRESHPAEWGKIQQRYWIKKAEAAKAAMAENNATSAT